MKILKATILALLFVVPTNLFAQPSVKKTMEVSTNPLALIGGGFELNYRLGLSDTIAVGAHGTMEFLPNSLIDMTKQLGMGLRLSSKFFLSGDSFTDSWYIEPSFGFSYHKTKFGNDPVVSFWRIAPMGLIGYNWVWSKGFSLNLGLGAQYRYVFRDKRISPNRKYDPLFKGIWPAGELSMGWAW